MIDFKAICDGLAARFAPRHDRHADGRGRDAQASYAAVRPRIVPGRSRPPPRGAGRHGHREPRPVEARDARRRAASCSPSGRRPGRVETQRQLWLPYLLHATVDQLKIGLGGATGYSVDKAIPTGWEWDRVRRRRRGVRRDPRPLHGLRHREREPDAMSARRPGQGRVRDPQPSRPLLEPELTKVLDAATKAAAHSTPGTALRLRPVSKRMARSVRVRGRKRDPRRGSSARAARSRSSGRSSSAARRPTARARPRASAGSRRTGLPPSASRVRGVRPNPVVERGRPRGEAARSSEVDKRPR
jgi:hypothetical protein